MLVPTLSITVIDHSTGQRRSSRHSRSPLRIGRDPTNDVVLPQSFVSRWHAVVRFDEAAATLFAIGAANPLRIGGRALEPGAAWVIHERQVITLGPLELHLELRPREGAAPQVVIAADAHAAVSGPADADAAEDAETAGPLARVHGALSLLAERQHAALEARAAWERSREDALADLDPDDPEEREALALLHRELDVLEVAIEGGPLPPPSGGGEALALARELALRLVPGEPPPADEAAAERLVDRLVDALRTFAGLFAELDRIWDEERERLGAPRPRAALDLAGGGDDLLAALLVGEARPRIAAEDLIAHVTCLQDHVRALLQASEAASLEAVQRLAPARFGGRRWPGSSAARWRAYCREFDALYGEGRATGTLRRQLQAAHAAALGDPLGGGKAS